MESRILHLSGEVENGNVTELIGNILEFNEEDKDKAFKTPIKLYINSNGGALEDGIALVNCIKTSDVPVLAYVYRAESIATVIALSCDEVNTFPNTIFMIHDLAYEFGSKLNGHKEELKYANKLQEMIDTIIIENSKITYWELKKKYETSYDWFIIGDEIKKLGMTNKILKYKKNRNTTFVVDSEQGNE